MRKLVRYAIVLCIAFAPLWAFADSLTVNFDQMFDFNTNSIVPASPIGGTLQLDLNADGTISAVLTSNVGVLNGFAFNSTVPNPGSLYSFDNPNHAYSSIYLDSDWGTQFGTYNSGWFTTGPANTTESFIISTPSGFSSVYQVASLSDAFTGGMDSLYGPPQAEFFMNTNAGVVYYEFGGNASAPVPEPSSLLLLGSGLVATVGAIRRRLKF